MKLRRIAATPSSPPPRGFPRWAWWTLFLATFMFVVPLTSPWWSTVLRGEIPGAEEEGEGPVAGPSAVATPEPVVPGSTLKVVLHMRLADRPGLGKVEREVPYVRGIIPQIKAAVSELAVASAEAPALLPAGTRVLDVAYTPGGTVYVDFSPEIESGRSLGTEEERILVQGIVTTIADNFTAARRVFILVDGKVPKPGHLDLSRALRHDDPLFTPDEEPDTVASEPPAPDPGTSPAAASPAPVPSPVRSQPQPIQSPAKPAATPVR